MLPSPASLDDVFGDDFGAKLAADDRWLFDVEEQFSEMGRPRKRCKREWAELAGPKNFAHQKSFRNFLGAFFQ
eukprot:scaffold419_cov147-Skeletonema_menzelii.AAC.6